MSRLRTWLIAGFAGAALAYFLDPNRGARRRNMTRDRLGALLRRLAFRSRKRAEFMAGHLYGLMQESVPHRPDNPNPDDKTLKDRVESEIFRSRDVPKGDINVNVAYGVVELRGELPHPDDISALVERVRMIPDVKDVVSYLHLPNTPAPNKLSAERVS